LKILKILLDAIIYLFEVDLILFTLDLRLWPWRINLSNWFWSWADHDGLFLLLFIEIVGKFVLEFFLVRFFTYDNIVAFPQIVD
jgi:hypothetical protein